MDEEWPHHHWGIRSFVRPGDGRQAALTAFVCLVIRPLFFGAKLPKEDVRLGFRRWIQGYVDSGVCSPCCYPSWSLISSIPDKVLLLIAGDRTLQSAEGVHDLFCSVCVSFSRSYLGRSVEDDLEVVKRVGSSVGLVLNAGDPRPIGQVMLRGAVWDTSSFWMCELVLVCWLPESGAWLNVLPPSGWPAFGCSSVHGLTLFFHPFHYSFLMCLLFS